MNQEFLWAALVGALVGLGFLVSDWVSERMRHPRPKTPAPRQPLGLK